MFPYELLSCPLPIEMFQHNALYLLGLAEARHALVGGPTIGLNCAPRPGASHDEHDSQSAN
jgi:hypothetical protein